MINKKGTKGIKKFVKVSAAFTAFIIITVLGARPSVVYGGYESIGLENRKITLSVKLCAEAGNDLIPLPGVTLSAKRVAELSSDGFYRVADDYSGSGISASELSDMNASMSNRLAARFAGYAAALQNPEEYFAVSDANGTAVFDLSTAFGIYLVEQEDSEKQESEYHKIQPFLVQVPQPSLNSGNGWLYDVATFPKLTKKGSAVVTPETPSRTPSNKPAPSVTDPPEKNKVTPKVTRVPSGGNTRRTVSAGGSGKTAAVKTGDLLATAGLRIAAAVMLAVMISVLRSRRRR